MGLIEILGTKFILKESFAFFIIFYEWKSKNKDDL